VVLSRFFRCLYILDKISAVITQQAGWENIAEYDRVLQLLPKIINPVCWSETRFPSIAGFYRWLTSSAALAQELSLQRYSLLKRLNSQLKTPLGYIRFLPARWQRR